MFDEAVALYKRLRLYHYQSLFGRIRDKDGSLSATEAFSVDAIYLLGEPTIKQFSDFLGISQPNASYKVSSLIAKGYIEKLPSPEDKREYRLRVADRFYRYYDDSSLVFRNALIKFEEKHTPQEVEQFREMLSELKQML